MSDKEKQEGTEDEGKKLYKATSDSDVKAAKKLLEQYTGKDFLEYLNNSQDTPLIKACTLGRENKAIELVTMLLDAGANKEHKNKNGLNAIMTAAKRGFPLLVDLLIKRGCKTDEEDPKGKKAFDLTRSNAVKDVFIAETKRLELLAKKREIERKGRVLWDCIKKKNYKAINDMAKSVFPEVFNWFEEKPKPKPKVEEKKEMTAEDKEQELIKKATGEYGMSKRDKMRAKLKKKKEEKAKNDANAKIAPSKATIKVPVSIHQPGVTYAVKSRDEKLLTALLDAGADVNIHDPHDGKTPLHNACLLYRMKDWPNTTKSVEQEQSRAKMVQELIDTEAELDAVDNLGRTAIMDASVEGYEDLIELLSMEGADVNIQDHKKDTALIIAARRGMKGSMNALIAAGASVNKKGNEQMTALMWAAYWGRIEQISLLLEKGAKAGINIRSFFGHTALNWAISNKQDQAAIKLLEAGADPNIALKNGTPPLVTACRQNASTELIQALLTAKADPNGRGFEGLYALHWCMMNVNKHLCRVMLYGGANPLKESTNGLNAIEMAVTVEMRIMTAEAAEMYDDKKRAAKEEAERRKALTAAGLVEIATQTGEDEKEKKKKKPPADWALAAAKGGTGRGGDVDDKADNKANNANNKAPKGGGKKNDSKSKDSKASKDEGGNKTPAKTKSSSTSTSRGTSVSPERSKSNAKKGGSGSGSSSGSGSRGRSKSPDKKGKK